MNDRQLAFKILNKIERDNSYSNLVLDHYLSSNDNDNKSNAFVSALVYGVTERRITLDYILSLFLKQSINRLKPEVLTILRLGVLQLKFMNSIPVSAAVNESVNLSKKNSCSFASGLINSVLRKISSTEIEMPNTEDDVYNLSVLYSCPMPLVKHYIDDYGKEDAVGILKSSIGAAQITARVNTLKVTTDELISLLQSENITALKYEPLENTIILKDAGHIEHLNAYKKGLFHIQDTASTIAINSLELKEGQTLIDVCSAPGGKAFTAAEIMNNNGKIVAIDLYEQRVKLISDGAKRLSIDIIDTKAMDSSIPCEDLINIADRVLCDVPCSGLGVIRKKPEIRYKDLAFIDNLTVLQYNILATSSKYLKKGGILVYSTCTLNKAENDEICDEFLKNNNEFEPLGDYTTLMPHKNDCDGFFIAKFRRV
ncbi:MAG: 16S rRNA (cytosine(967)-C(5))-methyltransferase RsmB [Oscillospiraceae bacterium]